jgi:hypothetical protein
MAAAVLGRIYPGKVLSADVIYFNSKQWVRTWTVTHSNRNGGVQKLEDDGKIEAQLARFH